METELSKIMMEYQYMPLRDVVFYTLRRGILQGDLKPGERLMEVKLANQLGVSRTPIREAIRMLELEGLVVMIPRKGAQVSEITAKDLQDVLEVRQGLEELAVKFACQRISKEQLKELYQASRAFEAAVKTDVLMDIVEADMNFHEVVYAATGNERLIQMLGNMREQMFRYRMEYLKDENVRKTLIREHDTLWERLKAGDLEGARDVMSSHIEGQQNYILKTVKK